MTGWRVGWAIASAPLTARIRKVHDYLTICAPGPFQMGGVAALALPVEYYTAMQQENAARRSILLDGLSAAGFTYQIPKGAYYVMADFREIQWDMAKYARPNWSLDRTFAEYLARDIGVAVVPGSSFDTGSDEGHSRVRFNFAKTPTTLTEAVHRLQKLRGR